MECLPNNGVTLALTKELNIVDHLTIGKIIDRALCTCAHLCHCLDVGRSMFPVDPHEVIPQLRYDFGKRRGRKSQVVTKKRRNFALMRVEDSFTRLLYYVS